MARGRQLELEINNAPSLVTKEDLHKFQENHPEIPTEIQQWLELKVTSGSLNELLLIVRRSGKDMSTDELLIRSAGAIQAVLSQPSADITSADLAGKSESPFRILLRENHSKPIEDHNKPIYGVFGSYGHRAVGGLEAGYFPDAGFLHKHKADESNPQLSFFPLGTQISFNGSLEASNLTTKYAKAILPGGLVEPSFIGEVKNCWEETVTAYENNDLWKVRGLLPNLAEMMAPVYYPHVNKIISTGRASDARMISIMSLVPPFLSVYGEGSEDFRLLRENGPIFLEIPFHYQDSMGKIIFGRADGIRFTSIDGKPLSEKQQQTLKTIAESSKDHFVPLEKLVTLVKSVFDAQEVTLEVIENKFAVGDHPDRENNILNEKTTTPLPAHVGQVIDYQTRGNLLLHFNDGRDHSSNLWEQTKIIEGAVIIYMLPTDIRTHKIGLSPNEQQGRFKERVLFKEEDARDRALNRAIELAVIQNVIGNSISLKPPRVNVGNPLIGETLDKRPTIQEIFEGLREYIGDDRILEKTGLYRDGNQKYTIHLDNLMSEVAKGKVGMSAWNEQTYALVSCVFPDHQDNTPSMMVDFRQQDAFCFGCEQRAILVGGFTSNRLEVNLPRSRGRSRWNKNANGDTQIPERHHQIMKTATDIFNEALRKPGEGKRGWRYISQERQLDPELALLFKVGIGTNETFDRLLDAGFSFSELVELGFVGFSPRLDSYHGLLPRLVKRGFLPQDVVSEQGRPYFRLADRVTFPLTFVDEKSEIKNTNFYGRAIANVDKGLRHRKLPISQTGVVQGMFNAEALLRDQGEVVVCEGAFDALSWIQLIGNPQSLAIIGVANYQSLDLIADRLIKTENGVGIALDADDIGNDKAARLIQGLMERGVDSDDIRHLTGEFIEKYPWLAKAGGKDANEWLKKVILQTA